MARRNAYKEAKAFIESPGVKLCPECYNPLYANQYSYKEKKYVCGKCSHEEVVK